MSPTRAINSRSSRLVEGHTGSRHCPHKACSLYDQLNETVVPQWIKDERISLLDFIDQLKDAYLVA